MLRFREGQPGGGTAGESRVRRERSWLSGSSAVLVVLLVFGGVAWFLAYQRQQGLDGVLEAAMLRGDLGAMRSLVRAGATRDLCLDYNTGNKTVMAFAVEEGDLELMELLFRRGVKPDDPVYHGGVQPILAAAMAGQLEAVRLLLDRGVPPDLATEGQTALMHAAAGPHRDVVELLLARGADPAAAVPPRGLTPLHGAAWGGDVSIIRRFLDLGARVDATADQGVTPLMKAAWSGKPAAVRVLLGAGADPTRKDGQGRTARGYVQQRKHREVAELLLRAERRWRRGK